MADTLTPFATVANLSAYWRLITAPETPRVEVLLSLSSNRLRLMAEDAGFDIDAKVAASPAYASTVQWVVMEAVKRAMQQPVDQTPMESYQQTAGPYSENYKYSNPTGDLWFKKSELSSIGLNGNQVLGSLSTASADIYGS